MNKIAAIQMVSSTNVETNLATAKRFIEKAAQMDADLVVLPEDFAIMGKNPGDRVKHAEPMGEGPIQDFLAEQAHAHDIWIVGGSIPILAEDISDKSFSSTLVFDNEGECRASYDKIHLFDVTVKDSHGTYCESAFTIPGDEPVVLETPVGTMGLALCYDLRFPELFRIYAELGVDLIVIPAAFTAVTGRAHWEVLLRARAIENLSYVVAGAQGGVHENGRETHGHSMIINPWGEIIAEQTAVGEGIIVADIDLETLDATRESFPALDHIVLL